MARQILVVVPFVYDHGTVPMPTSTLMTKEEAKVLLVLKNALVRWYFLLLLALGATCSIVLVDHSSTLHQIDNPTDCHQTIVSSRV